jgi:hypothetical protein
VHRSQFLFVRVLEMRAQPSKRIGGFANVGMAGSAVTELYTPAANYCWRRRWPLCRPRCQAKTRIDLLQRGALRS